MDLSSSGQFGADQARALVPLRHRDDGWTPARQRDFLEQLAACGSVTLAARAVGMSRESAYALRRRAEARAFALAWDAARALAVEHLTEVAWDRALHGEARQVYYHGELVGETRHYDNRLLLALIAQNRAAAGPAIASSEQVASIAADWDAALGRVERGEALVETAPVCAMQGAIAPPLPRELDRDGEPLDEAQQLQVGGYGHWWDEAGDRWLTNWPEPEHFDGEEVWVDEDGAVLGPYDEDSPAEDRFGLPVERDWARTLTAEEQAGLEQAEGRADEQRERRLELYRRAAFGLASAAELEAIAAVNSGDRWTAVRRDG